MTIKFSSRQMAICGVLGATALVGGGWSNHSAAAEKASTVDKYPRVPTPTVNLLPSAGITAARNYPFLAADFNPKAFGFVEEEFLMEGKANSYDVNFSWDDVRTVSNTFPVTQDAKVVSTGNPYRTRMMVYRPSNPAKFNGTVIVEMVNASNGFDTPIHWFEQKNMILRKGYAYVGLTTQDQTIAGATGLKTWSPTRYGTLDVSNNGKFKKEELSWDIISQAAKAVRAVPKLIGGMAVKKVIAAGESQSAMRMGIYMNSYHPLTGNIFDAALETNSGVASRTDLAVPIIRIQTESEFASTPTNSSTIQQLDTEKFKTWLVAGATHSNLTSLLPRTVQYVRDFDGKMINDGCSQNSRVPLSYVYNSAIDKLEKYLDRGTPIPTSPPMQITADPKTPSVARDADGIALGGIRLPDVVVPVAVDSALYGSPNCNQLGGSHVPMTKAKLDSLYPTHEDYVSKVTAAANKAVTDGFMLEEDARDVINNAKASIYGRQLNCGTLCADRWLFPQHPSILNLRWHIYLYYLPNSAKILVPVDDAAIKIATAYNYVDAAGALTANGKMYVGQAVALLHQYESLVQNEVANQALSQDAATYLSGQAQQLIAELQKLP